MSNRPAKRPLTGRPCRGVEVVLGHRPNGKPGVTLYPDGCGRVPLADADVVRALIADLQTALTHMEQVPEPPPRRELGVGVWHHGRRFWGPDRLSWECECPKTPCGLTVLGTSLPSCPFHGPSKTLRQGHHEDDCPGVEDVS